MRGYLAATPVRPCSGAAHSRPPPSRVHSPLTHHHPAFTPHHPAPRTRCVFDWLFFAFIAVYFENVTPSPDPTTLAATPNPSPNPNPNLHTLNPEPNPSPNQVVPNAYGRSQPLWYLFLPSYWGFGGASKVQDTTTDVSDDGHDYDDDVPRAQPEPYRSP